MEEEEKLTEAELREDAESYMNKLRLRSEFAIIIGVPLLLFLCYAEYSFNRDLIGMILLAVLCVILALSNIMRCKAIKSIDFHETSLQEIALRMKTMKKRQTFSLYAVLGCVLAWIVVLPFVNWGFVLPAAISCDAGVTVATDVSLLPAVKLYALLLLPFVKSIM